MKWKANKKTARVAGILYLTVILCGVFAEFFVRAKLIVPDDASSTANNINTSEWLFRVGFVSDLIMQLAYFSLSLVLYRLLNHVNKSNALLMVSCVVVAVSIMCLNMLNHFAALLLLDGSYPTEFETDQRQALVMLFLKMHGHGYLIAQIFFGLWLFPLGYLVGKSGYCPKILGILLMIGSVGYLIDFFRIFLLPDNSAAIFQIVTIPADIGEFSLCLWLLIKGVKDQHPATPRAYAYP